VYRGRPSNAGTSVPRRSASEVLLTRRGGRFGQGCGTPVVRCSARPLTGQDCGRQGFLGGLGSRQNRRPGSHPAGTGYRRAVTQSGWEFPQQSGGSGARAGPGDRLPRTGSRQRRLRAPKQLCRGTRRPSTTNFSGWTRHAAHAGNKCGPGGPHLVAGRPVLGQAF